MEIDRPDRYAKAGSDFTSAGTLQTQFRYFPFPDRKLAAHPSRTARSTSQFASTSCLSMRLRVRIDGSCLPVPTSKLERRSSMQGMAELSK